MTTRQLDSLQKEFDYFNQVVGQLKKDYPHGGFAVVKDQHLLGVWKTRNEALAKGLEKFGDVVFLVRSIEESEAHKVNFSFNAII